MADIQTLQFLDLAGTTELKNQILAYVDAKDAASIKGVGISGNETSGYVLDFYKSEPISGATPSYQISLPKTDLSALMELVTGAVENNIAIFGTNGQVKDSGKKLADFYLKTEVDELLAAIEEKIAANTKAISDLDADVTKRINAAKTEINGTITSTKDELQGNIDAVDDKADANAEMIGNLSDLDTSSKGNLVDAINETLANLSANEQAGKVTMEESTSSDYAKVYTFKQGGASIGSVNIPRDLFVESGEVVVNPTGQPAGTYIKLVLANSTSDVIYVNVGTLVDIYKAEANATQVQLAIDSSTREISATIVGGSITATELAADAVTTVKIANKNVTRAKLSDDVQTSLTKADNAASQANLDAETAAREAAVSALEKRLTDVETDLGADGSVDEKVADAVSEANSYTDQEIGKVNATIGTPDSGKTIVQMIESAEQAASDADASMKAELEAQIAQNTKSITDLTTKHNNEVNALQTKDTEHEASIKANADNITSLQTQVNNIQAIPVATITGLFA